MGLRENSDLTPENEQQEKIFNFFEKRNNATIEVDALTLFNQTLEQQQVLANAEDPDDDAGFLANALEKEKDYAIRLIEHLQNQASPEIPPEEQIKEFYQSDRFEELYLKAQADKESRGDYNPVKAEDVAALLLKGSPDDVRMYHLLEANASLSKQQWFISDVRRRTKEQYNENETATAHKFIRSQLKPADFNDLQAAAKKFHAAHLRFSGDQKKVDWFVAEAKKLEKELEPEWKEQISEFYESATFKALYIQLSQNLGRAPMWDDLKSVLKANPEHADSLYLMTRFDKHSQAEWTKQWQAAEEAIWKLENEELVTFEKTLKPADWEDVDALANQFQALHKRFGGAIRLKWYKNKLAERKTKLETQWQNEVDTFFKSEVAQLYDQVAARKKGYPKWSDISAKITDPDLKYLLEQKYRPKAEGLWKNFWQEREKTFNEAGNQKLATFLKTLAPEQLDDISQAKADFEAKNPELQAAASWFDPAFEKARESKKAELESNHQNLVNTLPDPVLANAMQSAFEKASTFADRAQWLDENRAKVAEYTPLINQNQAQEARLTAEVERHPDLKKSFNKTKAEYEKGRTNYTSNFFSPRKYAEALNLLSLQLQEREGLVDRTLESVKQKSLRDVPQLPKKTTSFEEFRDALKSKKFYALDDKARKDERVRTAIAEKNKTLYTQWLSERQQYLDRDTKEKINNAKRTIDRVKLPKKLPEGLDNYEAFRDELKQQKVYEAIPAGVKKNEPVRFAMRQHNEKLFAEYQAEQTDTKNKTEAELPPEQKEAEALKVAQETISKVTLTPALQAKITERLPANQAQDPNQFTITLRDLNVYEAVEPRLLKNEDLRHFARQHNQTLQKQYLANLNKAPLKAVEGTENSEKENNYGLPGHYKINWDAFEQQTNPDERKRALERFKQMHNRSEIGLQTVMQQFHQPLGTFILQTLAVMPQDRYDKALNALKDVRVEAGKRNQASNWLKVLCENAGFDFIAKENSAAWSELKRTFSTHFGSSLDKAWEIKAPEVEADTPVETTEATADQSATDRPDTKAEETDETAGITSSAATDDQDEDSTATEISAAEDSTAPEALMPDAEERELEADDIDETREGSAELSQTESEPEAALDVTDPDLQVTDKAVDTYETEEAEEDPVETTTDEGETIDETTDEAEPDITDDNMAENLDEDPDDEAFESPESWGETDKEATDTDVETDETSVDDTVETASEEEDRLEEEPDTSTNLETSEATDDTESLEANDDDIGAVEKDFDDDFEDWDDAETQTEAPDTVEAVEASAEPLDVTPASETTEPDPDPLEQQEAAAAVNQREVAPQANPDTEKNEDSLITSTTPKSSQGKTNTSTEEPIPTTRLESEEAPAAPVVAEKNSDFATPANPDTQNTQNAEIEETDKNKLEADIAGSLEPEIIESPSIEAKEKEAAVQEALLAWRNFTETNMPVTVSQEAAYLKKQFSEILKSGLNETTIAKLKASGTWERLMASPAHQQLLRTHLKQHQALSNEGLHFFTALQQELYFSQSMTVQKFLQQLKNYVQFTSEVTANVNLTDKTAELDREAAQSLFNAFATRYHKIKGLKSLALSYANHHLEVSVTTPAKAEHWQFKAPRLEAA